VSAVRVCAPAPAYWRRLSATVTKPVSVTGNGAGQRLEEVAEGKAEHVALSRRAKLPSLAVTLTAAYSSELV
jgi:hypothetical protein